MSIPVWFAVSFSVTALATGFAVWKGGPPERATGVFLFLATQATFLIADRRWIDVQFAVLALDVAALILLGALALFADRWWPMWTAGLQGLAVIIHLAFWMQHKVISLVYSIALNIIGYAVLLTLVIGTVSYIRRRKRLRAITNLDYRGAS
ncbi:MAG: hypothetical protein KF842_01435 [Caulobacter sp.]|nr:hypothetical protein [Caulobacter sp.]